MLDDTYTHMQRRLYFELFYPFVTDKQVRRALILMGPRWVGKTVMLFHAIDELIKGGGAQKIVFVALDNPNLCTEKFTGSD